MTDEGQRTFGGRIARLRAERGMTQKQFAAEIGRTPSWLSQVERGVQPVNRLDVLRLLADALGVSVQELRPDAPQENSSHAPVPVPNDLDQARLLISGHPALDVLLGTQPPYDRTDLADLRTAVDEIWQLAHSNRYAELSTELGRILPRLERAARTAVAKDRPEAYSLLARAYQALSAAFVRQNEADAAWVAADRSISAAERSGRPLDGFAGIFRLAHAFVRLGRYDQAEHAARSAISALRRYTDDPERATEAALSLLGALHLVLALVFARAKNRTDARKEMECARRVARRLGEDRDDFDLEFGPTNVEIQAVSIAVDLGDAGEAIDIGETLDAAHLSAERQARLAMDLGRAHAQLRHAGEAIRWFLRAEELAPEMVKSHIAARSAVRDLMLVTGRSAPTELKRLADRTDAMA
ncbi:helix-turn-helix domain-containing protein [Streptomyces sp. B-S-A8]|uniref:Helix-turn-helix domain-containing protein n=1 Tax=Streptomyces solicavernae TaxID=3043614 RepID=A0ABT6RMD0_9ACTN|nr:helix-turn-helix domain-containing protein [Streptomyces sp. B-S-A8]MDI3385587.1 helix-turn-helix domain-containing protein [Streptomyces sp. B-S-A8]